MQSLREARLEKGIKVKDIAEKIGVTERMYYYYEKEPDKMTIGKAKAICEYIGCSIDDVFAGADIFLSGEGSITNTKG